MDVNHSDRAHSAWGASSAHRWMECPASVMLSRKVPPQESSVHALAGTCAHELAEVAITEGKDCASYIGREFEGWEVTEEMAEYVQVYVDYVKAVSNGPTKELILEEKFDLSFIREGLFGSNDACVLEFMGTLEVIDLKYGKGKEVFAENNPQLMYYALGAAHGQDFKEVKLTIVQPRIENSIKSWTISMDRLTEFGKELGYAVDRTKDSDAELKEGPHCFFCPAKAICPEQRRKVQEIARQDFEIKPVQDKADLPTPESLSGEVLKNVLESADQIKKWLDSVSVYAQHQLEQGKTVLGHKLVAKRANRRVQCEHDLHMAFGDEIYEKKLLTVGKLEKKFGKADVEEFLYKPDAGYTIAPLSDKRKEVEIKSAIDDFEILNDKDDNYDNYEF